VHAQFGNNHLQGADRAYIIEKGQIRWEGAMARLLEDDAARRAYLTI